MLLQQSTFLYKTPVHCIHRYHLLCNALVHVIYFGSVWSMFVYMYQYLFTLLASEKGEVLIWGCNKHGQCALDPAKSSQVNVPSVVDQTVFEGQMVTRIRSGWTHLLAQTGKTVNWVFIVRLWFSQNIHRG